MKKVVFAVMATVACVQPALAKAEADLQNWSFAEGRDFCEMAATYDGNDDIRLGIALTAAGEVLIGASSTVWKIEKNKTYNILYSVRKNIAGETQIKGWTDGEYRGFVNTADLRFVDDMMKNGFFKFRIGAAGVSGRLETGGSDGAYTQFKACVAALGKSPPRASKSAAPWTVLWRHSSQTAMAAANLLGAL